MKLWLFAFVAVSGLSLWAAPPIHAGTLPDISGTWFAQGDRAKRCRISGGESERGIGIAASSFDDPSAFRPQFDIHVADAQPWDQLDPAIPKFDRYPLI